MSYLKVCKNGRFLLSSRYSLVKKYIIDLFTYYIICVHSLWVPMSVFNNNNYKSKSYVPRNLIVLSYVYQQQTCVKLRN